MADNVNITAGAGTIVAADDLGGGVLAQRIKLVLGPDGTGNDALAGAGVNGTGVQRVTIATDQGVITTQLPATLGSKADAASMAISQSTEDKVIFAATNTKLDTLHTDVTATNTQLPTTPSGAVQATITRPANTTQYSAGDVVGGAITLATGLTSGQRCMLTSMDLMLQIAALPGTPGMTTLDVHFYNVTPPSAIADNGVFDIPSGDRASYLGKVSLTTPIDYGSTLMSQLDNINKQFQLSGSANLFAYLVTTTSYTPAANSEVYLLRAHFLGL